jgi:hypothetical protein
MRQQQAQIDALEHLVVALYKELRAKTDIGLVPVINAAKASAMGSESAGDPAHKAAAVQYLEHLGWRLGNSGS